METEARDFKSCLWPNSYRQSWPMVFRLECTTVFWELGKNAASWALLPKALIGWGEWSGVGDGIIFNACFKRSLMRVACRLHFENYSWGILATLANYLPWFPLLCKTKGAKRRPGLVLVNMRPQKPGQGSSLSLMGKKYWTRRQNESRLFI